MLNIRIPDSTQNYNLQNVECTLIFILQKPGCTLNVKLQNVGDTISFKLPSETRAHPIKVMTKNFEVLRTFRVALPWLSYM